MKAKFEAIKKQFLSRLDDDEAMIGLREAVASLEEIGADHHAAIHMVTHWAGVAGLFTPEEEKLAERQAEQIVDAA